MLGTTEIIFIALIILLLFGGKKIPELMKGLGKGVRSFKEGVNGIDDDGKKIQENVQHVNSETKPEIRNDDSKES